MSLFCARHSSECSTYMYLIFITDLFIRCHGPHFTDGKIKKTKQTQNLRYRRLNSFYQAIDGAWKNLCWNPDIFVLKFVHLPKINALIWLKWHQMQPWHWKGAGILNACLSNGVFLLQLTKRPDFFCQCSLGLQILDYPSGHIF